MSAVKAPPIVVIAIIALLLYWVVQDPIGAAAMIRDVFDWVLGFLQLLAERVVQFLSALT
jgi:cell shape-determining protein MreC